MLHRSQRLLFEKIFKCELIPLVFSQAAQTSNLERHISREKGASSWSIYITTNLS